MKLLIDMMLKLDSKERTSIESVLLYPLIKKNLNKLVENPSDYSNKIVYQVANLALKELHVS